MDKSHETPRYGLTLLRHAESEGNALGYYQGQSDYPLSEKGWEQARALARRWRDESLSFDHILSSPLSRARQTAQIIAEALELPVAFDPQWMERDNGVLAGLKPSEAQALHPRPDFAHPYLPIGESGESQWELYLRAGRCMVDLLRRPPGEYLVVSHGGLLNMVLYHILGITPQANFQGPRFRFRNAAFASITYFPADHQWYVWSLNDRHHWEGQEPTFTGLTGGKG